MIEEKKVYYAYMVRCGDGTLYSGYAADPVARTRAHNAGRGARYTKARLPVTLEYVEAFETRSLAQKRECALKRLARNEKEKLIACFVADHRAATNQL